MEVRSCIFVVDVAADEAEQNALDWRPRQSRQAKVANRLGSMKRGMGLMDGPSTLETIP